MRCNVWSTTETTPVVSKVGALLTIREKYTGCGSLPSVAVTTLIGHERVSVAKKAVTPSFRENILLSTDHRYVYSEKGYKINASGHGCMNADSDSDTGSSKG